MYQIAVYYNYAEDTEKPAVIRTTLRGLSQLRKTQRKDSLAADFYFRAGLAYQWDYQPDSALYTFKEARKMYEVLYGKQSPQVSDCFHCMGDVYCQSFYDYSKAEPLYERALAIREKNGSTTLNSYLVFKLYSELASVNRAQHEPDKALLYGLRFIAYADTIPYTVYKEKSYTVTAEIYSDLNQFDKAKELYKKAIALNLKSSEGDKEIILASQYLGLAETLEREGSINESINYYLKAIHLFNTEKGPKAIKHIYCFERLGELYLKINRLNEAAAVLRDGLGLLADYKLTSSGQASGLHKSMARYFEKKGLPDSALVHYQHALIATAKNFYSLNHKNNPSVPSIELKDYCYEVLMSKAALLNDLSKKTKKKSYSENALSTLILAEELLSLSRADLDRDDSKWIFFDSNYGVYEQLMTSLYEMQNSIPVDSLHRMVLKYMEKSKSKMLAEALNQANFSDPSLANDSLINALTIYKRNLHYLQDQQKKVDQKSAKENSELIQNSILETDRKIELTEAEINRKYPSYLKIKNNDNVPQLLQLTAFVKDKDACVLEYFWGAKKIFALGSNGNETIFKCLGDTDTLANVIIPVREFFKETKYSFQEHTVSDFHHQSYSLYQTLVAPFKNLIGGKEKIIIIPDGLVGQVPFEVFTPSLLTENINFKNLNYLVKSHVISYSFSSSYLLNQKNRRVNDPKLLAFAFTGNSDLRSGSNSGRANQLAGSTQELTSIGEKFPKGEFLYGDNVTESKFKTTAPEFDIIHLAVHGQGETDLDYSASLFFRDTNTGEDGELHWYELFGMRLKAKLAVISSCESGIGKTYRGEGMLSMASAFAYAGCPNIVMGLWKVDDRTSSELMNFFYDQLLGHNPVDQSLAISKRQYLENADELSAHPRLWASLVAYGNHVVIDKRDWRVTAAITVVVFSIVAIIIWVISKKRRLHTV